MKLTSDQKVAGSGWEFEGDVLEARGAIGEREGEVVGGDGGLRHGESNFSLFSCRDMLSSTRN